MKAISNRHIDCLRACLLKVDCTFLSKNDQSTGKSIVHEMCLHDYPEGLQLILEHGADVNVRSNVGYYPIHFAIMFQYSRCLAILLQSGASVCRYIEGENCLEFARKRNVSDDIIHQLLDAGVKPTCVRFMQICHARDWCLETTRALLYVLRKRYRISCVGFVNGYPIPLQIIQIICKSVWDTRQDRKQWSMFEKKN